MKYEIHGCSHTPPLCHYSMSLPPLACHRYDGTTWHPPLSLYLGIDSEFLNVRIQALTDVVNVIDNDLEAMGRDEYVSRKRKETDMDKVSYASELKRLHQNLISANKTFIDRVRECQARGLKQDEIDDAFWPNVMLPGCTKASTVILKDYGRVVDNAFNELMTFLIERKPVDSKKEMRKRNRLLNDKLISLLEIRKCQYELLPLEDYGPFALSRWSLYRPEDPSEIASLAGAGQICPPLLGSSSGGSAIKVKDEH